MKSNKNLEWWDNNKLQRKVISFYNIQFFSISIPPRASFTRFRLDLYRNWWDISLMFKNCK